MRVRFKQQVQRVCRKDDVVFGVPIRAAAVLDQRVFGQLSIRHSSPIIVVVNAIFIVSKRNLFETC